MKDSLKKSGKVAKQVGVSLGSVILWVGAIALVAWFAVPWLLGNQQSFDQRTDQGFCTVAQC